MFHVGYMFDVVCRNITGRIDGVGCSTYSVTFYKDGKFYFMADVFESTIINNLKCGTYVERGYL